MNTTLISSVTYDRNKKETHIIFDGEKEILTNTTKNFAIQLAYDANVKLTNT